MPLTLIEGYRGSGKTLFAVIITRNSKRPIYSNFRIKHRNYNKLKLYNLLSLPRHIEVIMDEGYSLIDSRISMSYVNIFAGYLLKMKNDIITEKDRIERISPSGEFLIRLQIIKNPTAIRHVPDPSPLYPSNIFTVLEKTVTRDARYSPAMLPVSIFRQH